MTPVPLRLCNAPASRPPPLPCSHSQAQKGPARQPHFGKQELMDLAEASGLSNKPIHGDGAAWRGRGGGQEGREGDGNAMLGGAELGGPENELS